MRGAYGRTGLTERREIALGEFGQRCGERVEPRLALPASVRFKRVVSAGGWCGGGWGYLPVPLEHAHQIAPRGGCSVGVADDGERVGHAASPWARFCSHIVSICCGRERLRGMWHGQERDASLVRLGRADTWDASVPLRSESGAGTEGRETRVWTERLRNFKHL